MLQEKWWELEMQSKAKNEVGGKEEKTMAKK